MTRDYFSYRDIIAALIKGSDKHSLGEKRFYGYFLKGIKKQTDRKLPAPAGVMFKDNDIILKVNPDMFDPMTFHQKVEILVHEARHIAFKHAFRTKKLGIDPSNKKMATMWNQATDTAINNDLVSINKLGWTPDHVAKITGRTDIDKYQAAEYYYYILKSFVQENPESDYAKSLEQNGEGKYELVDDHGGWDDAIESCDEEMINQKIKAQLKRAAEETNRVGNTPQEMQQAIQDLNKNTVNWKQQLRRFVARAKAYKKEQSRKKRNRRYGLVFPGKRKKPDLHLFVPIDESGSVSDVAHKQFFSEIDKIAREGIKITIAQIDTAIGNMFEYTPGMKISRHCCGGTYYNPALRKADELEIDGIIYFGDGGCFESGDELHKPKRPILWALEEGCDIPASFGKKIEVKLPRE